MKRPPIILDSIYILSGISSPFVYGLPSNVWSPASPPSAAQWASYPSRVFPARSSLRASPETASGARRWRFCLDDLGSDVYIIYIYIHMIINVCISIYKTILIKSFEDSVFGLPLVYMFMCIFCFIAFIKLFGGPFQVYQSISRRITAIPNKNRNNYRRNIESCYIKILENHPL